MTASLRAAPIAAVLLSLGVAVPAIAQTPTPAQVIEAFEGVQGPIRTHRPSHPKGICAAGSFEGTAEGARLSVSPTFSGQRIPTIIRFGVGGGPTAADTSRSTRSLSIRFQVPNGTAWDMANISVPLGDLRHRGALRSAQQGEHLLLLGALARLA